MTESIAFKAPWSPVLVAVTALGCVVLLGVPIAGLLSGGRGGLLLFMVAMPLTILLLAAVFGIWGYRLAGDTLYIQRLGWATEIPLVGLIDATVDPQAMDSSWRLWGNGGLFSFTGHFRNRRYGHYRAYATAPRQAVVLKFPQRTLVLTPDRPERFVREVLARKT